MSALSIPASSGYGAVPFLKTGVSSAQQQNTVQTTTNSSKSLIDLPRFSSPHIYIDPTSSQVVFETRDPQTGKLTNQLPSSLQLRGLSAAARAFLRSCEYSIDRAGRTIGGETDRGQWKDSARGLRPIIAARLKL